MQTREFWGSDMNEALREVRHTFGPDALILETLNVPAQAGETGQAGQARVKITALQDPTAARTGQPAGRAGPPAGRADSARPLRPARSDAIQEGNEGATNHGVQQQLTDLQTLLYWMVPELKRDGATTPLVAHGVLPAVISRLIREADSLSGESAEERLRNALIQAVPIAGKMDIHGSEQLRLALIGPPGMGKTSSLVKLTLRLMRRHNDRVGWIYFDTRRVTGAEELRAYAGILTLPCVCVDEHTSLQHALSQLVGCDAVLIDTAGTSPLDVSGLQELAAFLQEIPHLKKTLVLSATTQTPTLQRCIERYGRIGVDGLVFTMLDVCEQFGPLINTLLTTHSPLAYVATGPDVSQELAPAQAEEVSRLLLP